MSRTCRRRELSREARTYLAAHGSRWNSLTKANLRKRLRHFESWLREHKVRLRDLDAITLA